MVAKSFGRYSRHPKKKRDESKDTSKIPKKEGRERKRFTGKRTARKGKGKGKGKGKSKKGKRPPSPAP
jgi:hypothetical protein